MTPSDLFGSDSDGYLRMEEWLLAMCLGCRRELVRERAAGFGGGHGCDLAAGAAADPHGQDRPEWIPCSTWKARAMPKAVPKLSGRPRVALATSPAWPGIVWGYRADCSCTWAMFDGCSYEVKFGNLGCPIHKAALRG